MSTGEGKAAIEATGAIEALNLHRILYMVQLLEKYREGTRATRLEKEDFELHQISYRGSWAQQGN